MTTGSNPSAQKMDIKKIILTTSIVVSLISIALIAKGNLNPDLLLAVIAGAISAFYVYIIVSDFQSDARAKSIESSIKAQTVLLDKAVTVLPNGSFPIELISNPKDPSKWMHFQDELKAFNAPWTLASESLYPAFKNFLSKDNVALKALVFDNGSEGGNFEYTNRLERISKLVERLQKDGVNTNNKIFVKRVVDKEPPTTTFFLTQKRGYQTSILYIYPFIHEEPMLSIELNDATAYGAMDNQFLTYWSTGEEVEIN